MLLAANEHDHVRPFCADYSNIPTFNLDGLLTYRPTAEDSTFSYLQIFRNGVLESATSALILDRGNGLIVPSLTVAEKLGEFLDRALSLMKRLDINPPASMFVSLLNARGATLGISEKLTFYRDIHAKPFDRDNLLLREVTMMDWEGEPTTILRPLLNELWQAGGLPRCFDYDEAGHWKPSRY